MQDLGTLGGTSSSAFGINASGQVVGWARTIAEGIAHAFISNGGVMRDLNTFARSGWTLFEARDISDLAQIAGTGLHGSNHEAFLLTLHPDWQGGNGSWDGGAHWNYGGMGVMAITPGAPHIALIWPEASATVTGPADATVYKLGIGGNAGQIVTLQLAGGSTATTGGTHIFANGVLAGSGRLGGGGLVDAGGRIQVGAGEQMQLTGGTLTNHGRIQVQGSAANLAGLEMSSAAVNASDGQIQLQYANAAFNSGLVNSGQLTLSFGIANVSGAISNAAGAKVIVSNGASASFYDAIVNSGELRVSSGGAANFFGLVSGAGSFTGSGQKRYEGGFAPGASPAVVTLEGESIFPAGSTITMELGGTTPGNCGQCADKIIFSNGSVALEGGTLTVVWWGGHVGAAGEVYDLFGWNAPLTGKFGQVQLPSLAPGLTWQTGQLYTSGDIGITAVPEPASWAGLLAGLGVLALMSRRRPVR